jgi:hypothetical protein
VEKTPATVTSSAFSAPSVVLASSVRLLPGCGLQAARQAVAQHHLQPLAADDSTRAGLHLQERALDGELGVGVDAGGHHHGALVAVADQAAEFHPRQHLAHLRVGQQLGAQRGHLVQAVLQRHVFVALRTAPAWPRSGGRCCARRPAARLW